MTEPASTPLLATAVGTWQLDPDATTIEIHTKAMWGLAKVKGTFRAVSGSGVVGEGGAISGEIVVDPASINTKNKRRDEHLRSADFFEVSAYPTFSFRATEANASPDGTLTVKGDLLVKDQSHPVDFAATLTNTSPDHVTARAEATIDRSKWGMSWAKLGAGLVNRVIVDAQFNRS
jgi:polyisoprenoid-binding protein YceI